MIDECLPHCPYLKLFNEELILEEERGTINDETFDVEASKKTGYYIPPMVSRAQNHGRRLVKETEGCPGPARLPDVVTYIKLPWRGVRLFLGLKLEAAVKKPSYICQRPINNPR